MKNGIFSLNDSAIFNHYWGNRWHFFAIQMGVQSATCSFFFGICLSAVTKAGSASRSHDSALSENGVTQILVA